MSKPRAQGTAAETRIVNLHERHGIRAKRLPEGGAHDEGDVEIFTRVGRIVGEVRDREKLSAQESLENAVRKAGGWHTALFWTQRIPLKGLGLRRRTRRCVTIPEELWFELIGDR